MPQTAIQALAVAVHPLTGGTLSFPWQRSSTQSTAVKEYMETAAVVESLRYSVFSALGEFPWIERLSAIYSADDSAADDSHAAANRAVTKLSCLRIVLQMLKNNKELSQLQAQAGTVMGMANEAIKNKGNDSVLTSTGLLLISAMAKQFGSIKRDVIEQYIDVKIIIELFERNASVRFRVVMLE